VTRFLTLTALTLGLLMQAERASGSAFRVTPVKVELSQKSASTLLTLTNESGDDLRFQITAFAWSQDPKGGMKLAPTQDITFFPALLSLKPGEERKVRVGAKTAATDMEKSYRMFFEELPPLTTPTAPPQGAQVRILTKMGVPIFLTPTRARGEAGIGAAAVSAGKLTFDVHNSGNVHFSVHAVKVSGLAGDGTRLFEKQVDGWYVLPGTPRSYEVEIPADLCSRVSRIEIQAQTDLAADAATRATQIDVPKQSCKATK